MHAPTLVVLLMVTTLPAVEWVHVGTACDPRRHTPEQSGIYRVGFDQQQGCFTGPAVLVASCQQPGWLAWHPALPVLYATIKPAPALPGGHGGVAAYAVTVDGTLTMLGLADAGGRGPCHLTATGSHLLIAIYQDGAVAALPLDGAGGFANPAQVLRHAGPLGPHPKRQEAAHAHCMHQSPGGRWILSCDLGLDHILVHRLADDGRLVPHGGTAVHPGGGPRHLAFADDGRFCYVNRELDNHLDTFAWDEEAGTLAHLQSIPTLPAEWSGASTTSEVAVTADGGQVFVGNRGHDSLATFTIAADGSLRALGQVPAPAHPRHFALSPDQQWILVAGRDADLVQVYRRDKGGLPVPTATTLHVPAPQCVRFAPRR